jgi:hypothetical protein
MSVNEPEHNETTGDKRISIRTEVEMEMEVMV